MHRAAGIVVEGKRRSSLIAGLWCRWIGVGCVLLGERGEMGCGSRVLWRLESRMLVVGDQRGGRIFVPS